MQIALFANFNSTHGHAELAVKLFLENFKYVRITFHMKDPMKLIEVIEKFQCYIFLKNDLRT